MAKRKTYYDPQDGRHYYHGETFGTGAKIDDVATGTGDYHNQYNFTPGAAMFQEYQRQLEEEERKRQQQALIDHRMYNSNLGINANANMAAGGMQRRTSNMGDYRDTIAGTGSRGGMVNSQANDVLNFYNDQLIRTNGRTLSPESALEYADASLKKAYSEYEGLQDLMAERNEYAKEAKQLHAGLDENGVLKTDFNPQYRGRYAREVEAKQKEVEDRIQKLTGWSESDLARNLDFSDRLQNKGLNDAFVNNTTEVIDPKDSKGQKIWKGTKNTTKALLSDPLGWAGETATAQSMTSNNPNDDILGRDTNTYANWTGNRNVQAQANTSANMGKVGQFLYETGYSAADSLVKRLPAMALTALGVPKPITEAVSLTPYFTQSFNQGYQEARQGGATDNEAMLSGITQGAIEVLTEAINIDRETKNVAGQMGKDVAKRFAKGAAEEGTEEMISTLANELVDAIIYRGIYKDKNVKTSFEKRVESYRFDKEGNERSKTAARALAALDLLGETGLSGLSGALSSLPSEGVSLAMGKGRAESNLAAQSDYSNRVAESITGETDYEKSVKATQEEYAKNPVQAFADQMSGKSENSSVRRKNLQTLADKVNEGKELTTKDKLYIDQAINEEIEETRDANKKGILTQLSEKFKKDEPSIDVDRANTVVPNEFKAPINNMSSEEAYEQINKAASEGNLEALSEAYNQAINSRSASTRSTAEEILPIVKGQLESKGVSSEDINNALMSQEEAYRQGYEGAESTQLTEKNKIAYNEGKLRRAEEMRVSVGVDSERAQAKLSSLNEADSLVYKAGMKEDTNANLYNVAWDRFYSAGETGRDFEKELKNGTNQFLSKNFDKETLRSIYDAGVQNTQTQLQKEASEGLNKALGIKKASGTFKDMRTVKNDNVDYEAYRFLASFTGQDIILADAKSGIFKESENAHFTPGESAIYINADASVGQGFHEVLGEFTEFYNAEGYETLRKSLNQVASDVLGASRYNEILNKYKSAYANSGLSDTSIEMSREMTNDMLVAMMSTKEGRDKLAKNLTMNADVKTAANIVDRIKSMFSRITDSIRSIIDNSKLSSFQREIMDKGAKELEANVDLFVKEFNKAVENARKVQENAQASESNAQTVAENAQFSIMVNGSPDAQFEELKDKIITIVNYKADNLPLLDSEIEKLRDIKVLEASNLLWDLSYALGIKKKYKNKDINFEFDFSKTGVERSVSHQAKTKTNDKYNKFGKLLTCFDDVVKNAYLIEAHTEDVYHERKPEHKIVKNIETTYVLLSAFNDEEGINPVKITVFEYKDNPHAIHMTISLPTIKNDKIVAESIEKSNKAPLSFEYSLADLMGEIKRNPASEELGEYISDKFATYKQYSIDVDSQGNNLSEGQKEYFRDSKVVDKDGNLKIMYHGSPESFNVFDIKKAKAAGLYGRGFYFSDSDSHAGTYGDTKKVYLNIVNPLQGGAKTITKDQMLKFINAVANDEDMGLENYGYGMTPQKVLDSVWGSDDFGMLQDINATCIGDFVGALKLFNQVNGTSYDGIIAPTETVVFYPNQIKLTTNENPTSSDDIRYSVDIDKIKGNDNVEVKGNLIAVHNMTADQLEADLDLKGFPSPSIAIIKAGMEHSKYGDVSVVFKKDTIDPKKNKANKVYGGDAWTPTFPRTEVKIDSDKVWDIDDKVSKLVSQDEQRMLGYLNIDPTNLEDRANSHNGDFAEIYRDKRSMQLAFLRDKNSKYEVPYKTTKKEFVSREGHPVDVLQFVAKELGDKFREYAENRFLAKTIYEGDHQIARDIMAAVNKAYRELYDLNEDFYGDEIKLEFKPDILKIARTFYDAEKVANGYEAEETTEFDRDKFDSDFNAAGGEEAYASWVNNLFNGVIEKKGLRNNKDVFLPSGNRRSWEALHDDYNIENIVNIMNQMDSKGADGFFAEAAFRALATKDFKSIEEMHKNESMLGTVTEEEYEALQREHSEKLFEIANEIKNPRMSNSFTAIEEAIESINQAIKGGKTLAAIQRGLNRDAEWLDLKPDTAQKVYDLLQEVSNMPTGYFEAKPRRAVWLDEIAYVILPDSVSSELIERLDDSRIEYKIYEAGNEKARANLLNERKDVRFSVDVDEIDFFSMSEEDIDKNLEEVGIPAFYRKQVELAGVFKDRANPETLRQIANKLRKEFGSTYNLSTFTDNLQKFFDYANENEHVSYEDFNEIMSAIARPFVQNISEKANPEEYKRFVDTLKSYGTIKLTSTQAKDVAHTFGSVKEYRAMMMPIANISSKNEEAKGLDTIWSELCDQFDGLLERDANEGDMPGQLYDALQTLRSPANNYGGSEEDVVKDVTMRILEEYLGGEQGKKIAERNKAYKEKVRKDYQERFEKAKGRYNAALIARNRKAAARAKDREKVAERRRSIFKNAKTLHDWASRPTKEKHIPRDMISPIMEFLSAFDFAEPTITTNDDGTFSTRVYVFDGIDAENTRKFHFETLTSDSMEELIRQYNEKLEDPTSGFGSKAARNWKDRMASIKKMYDSIENSDKFGNEPMSEFLQRLSPALAANLDDLLQSGSKGINNLNSDEMRILDNVLKNIIKAVNQGSKAYTSSDVDVSQIGGEMIKKANEMKEPKSLPKVIEGIKDMLDIDMLTPRTAFSLLGESGDKLYKLLRKGLNTKIADTKKASDFMEQLKKDLDLTDKEVSEWGGKKGIVREFKLPSGTVRMTDLQIMALYETFKQPGMYDRAKGGIKIKPIERKAGMTLKQNKAYHLSDVEVAQITGNLTDKQKKFADALQQYMAVECAAMGNETSMNMYGYEMFVNPTYFPIEVDRKNLTATDKNIQAAKLTGIRNSGFTNVRDERATNPIMIGDILDVFTKHVAQMADFHGYAASTTDILRWFNYKEVADIDKGKSYSSVQQALDTLMHSDRGADYFKQLLLDINGAIDRNPVAGFIDYFSGAFKASSVLANASVVIQQPFAYGRAANMIDPKYLLTVNPVKAIKNIEKVNEESPIAWWKAQGYYETSIGRSLKEIITGQGSLRDKINEKAGWAAGKADDITWAMLYQAVENEQRDKLKGQPLSKEEFRQRVNERFDDMIDQTQVVDSTLHRSQYMRSQRDLHKLQTAFMAEPTKSYNMLAEAVLKDVRSGDKNFKRTGRAVASWAVASIMTAAAKSLVGAMRHTKDDDEYWEVYGDEVKANIIDNLDPLQMIPWVKDIEGAFKTFLSGENSFGSGNARYDLDAITDLIDTLPKIQKYINGESKLTPYGLGMAIANPLSKFLGIPAYALARDVVAFYNLFFDDIVTSIESPNSKVTKLLEDVEKGKDESKIQQDIANALEAGKSVKDIRSKIKTNYCDIMEGEDEDAKTSALDMTRSLLMSTGMTLEEANTEIESWEGDGGKSYTDLDNFIKSNDDGVEDEVKALLNEYDKDPDKVVEHIMNGFGSTVDYERSHNTATEYEDAVTRALQVIDPTYTYDSVKADLEQKAKEKAEKKEAEEQVKKMKNDLFTAIDTSKGSDARQVINEMAKSGKEAGDIKGYISTEYHKRWKEATSSSEKSKIKSQWINATTLVNNTLRVEKPKDPYKTWEQWEEDQKEKSKK